MRVSKGVRNKNCEDILSGPGDLCESKFSNRLFTLSISIFNGGISGTYVVIFNMRILC